jgi:hypothetical protein
MSDDRPLRALRPSTSPTWEASQASGELAEARCHLPFQRDLLHGGRGTRRPLIAVATKKDLGPARHALSQMVVAGTMVVHPPLRADRPPIAPADLGPRVLTFTPPPVAAPPEAPPPTPPRAPPIAARPPAAPPVAKAPAWQRVDGATEVRELPRPDGKVNRVERRTLFRFDGEPSSDG